MEERPGPFVLGDRVEARLRGKSHWYPAEVVNVEAEAADDDDWLYAISYTDGYRDLHYPPPAAPKLEHNVSPSQMRKLSDHQSLTNLFDACGGAALNKVPKAGWARRTGWDREAVANMSRDARPFYEDVNNWDGVDTSAGRVSHVCLENNRLVNTLPPSLWTLDFLLELNLSNNELTGNLPVEVNQLKSITWLDLSGNKLGGRLPRSLGTCEHLKVLDLSNNEFNGQVPTTLGRLMDLKECRLSDNQFTGKLPLSFVESLKFCEDLCLFDLSNNDKVEGTDDFRDTLRKYLPMCSIFVGSPHLHASNAETQSFGAAARRPPSPTRLVELDEGAWEDKFAPPWVADI